MQQLSVKVEDGGATNNGKLFSDNWNDLATEVEQAIISSGQNLQGNDLKQLVKSIARLAQGMANWGTETGSNTGYVINPIFNTFQTLSAFDGMTVRFRPSNNNTVVDPTVNVFGIGVHRIVNEQGGAIGIGDLSTNRDAEIRWDGSDWRLLDRSKQPLSLELYPTGYISGFSLLDIGDGDRINVSRGDCSSFAGGFNLELSSSFTKNIKDNWTAGNGGGKPGSFSLSPSTWYRVFVIGGPSATTDTGIDTSVIAGNITSYASTVSGDTYDRFRQIGWIFLDSASNIVPFLHSSQDPDYVYWKRPLTISTGTSPPHNVAQSAFSFGAPGTEVSISVFIGYGSNDNQRTFYLYLSDPSSTDVQPGDGNWTVRSRDNATNHSICAQSKVKCDDNGNIRWRVRESLFSSSTGLEYEFLCLGYRYSRS